MAPPDLTPCIGYFQPDAHRSLPGSLTIRMTETPLRDSFGDWSIELAAIGEHGTPIVDGNWRDDPSAPRMEANSFGGLMPSLSSGWRKMQNQEAIVNRSLLPSRRCWRRRLHAGPKSMKNFQLPDGDPDGEKRPSSR